MDFASPLPHPGEILREEYMEPLGLTAGALARAMGLKDRTRIERLSRELQPVTAETALRLGRALGTSSQFWMNLQSQHDLSRVAAAISEELTRIEVLPAAAETLNDFIVHECAPPRDKRLTVVGSDKAEVSGVTVGRARSAHERITKAAPGASGVIKEVAAKLALPAGAKLKDPNR